MTSQSKNLTLDNNSYISHCIETYAHFIWFWICNDLFFIFFV